jgi:hypothetical protein
MILLPILATVLGFLCARGAVSTLREWRERRVYWR